MKRVEDNSFENYQLEVNDKYVFKFSFRKYFWRFLFLGLAIAKLVSLYFIEHPKFYRVFNLLFMDDIPKAGPMAIKVFLNQKIPSEYLTAYPLGLLILFLSSLGIWWILELLTSTISINYKFLELRTGILIFNKKIETVELIQIRDQNINTPWYHRLLGLGNLNIDSKDVTTPHLSLHGLDASEAEELMNFVRENSYQNITDLRRSQIVENKSKKKNTGKNNLDDDGEGYSD